MDRRRLAVAAAVAGAALAAAAPPARADLIRLSDGKTIEGKATDTPKGWTVKGYKGKTLNFAKSDVKFVEKAECSWEVYEKRSRAVPADAPDWVEQRLGLARYLRERREYCPELEELERKEYERIVAKDPAHAEARRGLGHLEFAGKWFKTEKERDSYKRNGPAAELEPLGYARYKKTGMWEKKEDIEQLESGKQLWNGKWMTPDEIQEAKGFAKDATGKWVHKRDAEDSQRAAEFGQKMGEAPVTVTSSDHFRFLSWFPVGETAKLKDLAEQTYAWYRAEVLAMPLGADGSDPQGFFDGKPIEVYAVISKNRKDNWLKVYGAAFGMDDGAIDFYTKGSGWHRTAPLPYFMISGREDEKNRARDPDADWANVVSDCTSMIGRICLDLVRNNQAPAWLREGTGFQTEIRWSETADCVYVEKTEYREQIVGKEGSRAKYYDFMKVQINAGVDRPLRQIFTLELNKLDWADAIKSWSFLEFLREKHGPALAKLLAAPMPQPEVLLPVHIEAAVKAQEPKAGTNAPPPKDPPKPEGPIPQEPVRIRGAGAVEVTPNSKEQRAQGAASAELWLQLAFPGKDITALEAEWKAWVLAK